MEVGSILVSAGTLLLSLVVALFKREIGSLYTSWAIYNSRPFDQDRDPSTPDRCQLYDASTGAWEDILIEKYQFSLNRDKRGVFICHSVPDKNGVWARERIPFDIWADMRKRTMPEAEANHPFEVHIPSLNSPKKSPE